MSNMPPPTEPIQAFAESFQAKATEGMARLRTSRIAVVGLARNCAGPLSANLDQIQTLADRSAGWQLHIEANDCTDDTLGVLHGFCHDKPHATFHYQVLGRGSFGNEFAGRRTIAMAEYRDACQRWVRACADHADYVIVVDWDQHGGWSNTGLLNSIGWLVDMPGAYGMASVSLFQHELPEGPTWLHYDQWALRGVGQSNCYWDTYRNGYSNWGWTWLPPIGSPPVLVSSAFGGLTIYRTDAFLKGSYDGTKDCEHVPFHQSIARATGQHLYLNPSQRCVMHWVPSCAETPQPSA